MADKTDDKEPKTDWKTRVYKGEMVDITELKPGIAIQAVDVVPKHKGKWGENPDITLPRLLTVDKVEMSMYGDTHRRVYFREPRAKYGNFRRTGYDIPVSYKVNRLTGRLGEELTKELAQFMEKQTWDMIPRIGITSGSDPEIFVEDGEGKVIPAYKFLPSKNDAPGAGAMTYRDPPKAAANNVYWDGFQAEFDTVANNCLAFHVDSIRHGLNKLYDLAKQYNKKAVLSTKVVIEADPNELANAEPRHVEFGCAPSLNAYNIKGKLADGRKTPYRFAGGHIHLGINPLSPNQALDTVKAMDAILGVSCVALFASFDNPIRRQYYGLPGEYRLPPHGLEYRTLSNAWLTHPVIAHLVFDLARAAAHVGFHNELGRWKGEEQETIEVIATSDVPRAKAIMERNKPMWLGVLRNWGAYVAGHGERAFTVFQNGLESLIEEPNNLVRNWKLGGRWGNHTDNDQGTWGYVTNHWTERAKW